MTISVKTDKTELSPPTLIPCSRCGELTEWDEDLGPEPLCVRCWDRLTDDINLVVSQRKYHQNHRKELNAKKRKYRQSHREEINAKKREDYQLHREELVAKQRDYYRIHREEIIAKQRECRQSRREVKI